jgi:hypothetical protein
MWFPPSSDRVGLEFTCASWGHVTVGEEREVAESLQHMKMLLSGVTRTRRCVNDPNSTAANTAANAAHVHRHITTTVESRTR